MKELSLFSGVGGGLLGTKHLLGWRTLGYVEFNEYCQKVLAARIKDGLLDNAPIFGDIRAFIDQGYAARYRNMVDVVSGGPPCQAFSCAGKRKGAKDERNMWPAMLEVIRLVRPRFALLENVPGLLSSGYFGTILQGLVESGYDCRWRMLSAAEMGAPHKRDRLWIVGHTNSERLERRKSRAKPRVFSMDNISIPSCFPQLLDDLPKPAVFRSRAGIPEYVERIKALGNAQVPCVAATAWNLLTADLEISI